MITLPFQRKKKEKIRSPRKKEEKSSLRVMKETQKEAKKTKDRKEKKELGKSNIAFSVLKEPVISEKATRLEDEGKYVFKVFSRANKGNVKRVIEEIYKVKVEKVSIVKVPSKKRRVGNIQGEKAGYKKAIVTLKGKERIEVVSR